MKAAASFCALTLLLGCGGPSSTEMAVDRTIRPAWVQKPNKSHPDLLYVTGSCRGIGGRFLARRCARLDAQVQVRKAFNKSSFELEDTFVKEEHFERRRRDPGSSRLRYDWWVLVAIPRSKLEQSAKTTAPTAQPAGNVDEERLLTGWRKLDAESQRALMVLIEKLAPRD